jgi:DNA-directed RNA polymerase II subunit RPB2
MSSSDNKTFNWDSNSWDIIDDVFMTQSNVFAKNQIESFNNACESTIPQIIEQHNPIMVNKDDLSIKISFGQIYISKPSINEAQGVIRPLLPQEARLRNLTYWSTLYVDVHHEYSSTIMEDGELKTTVITDVEKKIPFTKLPILLHSKFCHLSNKNEVLLLQNNEDPSDKGGYFIVKGSEKVIVAQERVVDNKVLCFKQNKPNTKYIDMVEIKSTIDQRFYPVKNVTLKLTKEASIKDTGLGKTIKVKIQHINSEIPLFIVFRALNILNDKDILSLILYDLDENVKDGKLNLLIPSILEANLSGKMKDDKTSYSKTESDDEEDDVNQEEEDGNQDDDTTKQDGDKKKKGDINLIKTQDDALEYMSKYLQWTNYDNGVKDTTYKKKYVLEIINREFLPHVGSNFMEKAYFLGYMTNVLLECHLGIREYDNRDHSSNKRGDLTGALICQIIRGSFQKLVRDIKTCLSKELTTINPSLNIDEQDKTNIFIGSLRKVIQNNSIESKLKYALSTGNWVVQSGTSIQNRAGIAQVLQRLSYIGYLSHIRRIQSPLEKAGSKLVPPRKLYGSQWGYIDPNETPEGAQVGVVKNLSLGTIISFDSSKIPILIALNVLKDYIKFLESINPREVVYSTKLFLNGKWIAIINNEHISMVYKQLKDCKRVGIIKPHISIYWNIDNSELFINADGGRYMRPVYTVSREEDKWELDIAKVWNAEGSDFYNRVKTNKIKWRDLLLGTFENNPLPNKVGVIEYIDTNESNSTMIALSGKDLQNNLTTNDMYLDYTHCEINANLIFGVVSPIIPFSDHNPAPRNCYECSMGKQAIGIYATNFNSRMDTMGHILCYPQKPLVYNRLIKHFYLDSTMPQGFQAMVAICTYSGFNQEDSIILNQSAIDRGFMTSLFYRTYKDEQQKHKSSTSSGQSFGIPDKNTTKELKSGSYDNLNTNGIIKKNSYVEEFDVLVGKISHLKNMDDKDLYTKKDVSTTVRSNEKGYVDLVFPSTDDFGDMSNVDADGNEIAKVRICELRIPEIGDKFASRAAQKGTVGMTYRQEDMPFNSRGEVPDIIMNPHAIPSRMTINQLLEDLVGKAAIITGGLIHDATAFSDINVEALQTILTDNGFDKNCNEQLYNGFTGEAFNVKTFFGPVYYQKLKHMVIDKIHSRSTGPNQLLTKQPAEGRSRDGGLRLGEMERDVLISHGATQFLKERFMESSDGYSVYVSPKEGDIVVANPDENYYMYNGKEIRQDEVVEVQLPYSMKLLLQELNSMGIYTKMVV